MQNSQKQVPMTLYSKQLVEALDAIIDAVLREALTGNGEANKPHSIAITGVLDFILRFLLLRIAFLP